MMLLQSLARQQGLDSWRQRLFAGAHVNNSEDRAALHMALRAPRVADFRDDGRRVGDGIHEVRERMRSEEHTSELQSLMRISYAVFCLKKKKTHTIPVYNKDIKK